MIVVIDTVCELLIIFCVNIHLITRQKNTSQKWTHKGGGDLMKRKYFSS
jgi:hypothetical protein